jgi:hypothetical protein
MAVGEPGHEIRLNAETDGASGNSETKLNAETQRREEGNKICRLT